MGLGRSPWRLVAAIAAALVGTAASAMDEVKFGADGITLREASGALELNLGGRLHYEALRYEEGDADTDEADFRRQRLELSGRIGERWRFRIDREFAGAGSWRNVWASVRATRDVEFRGGNFQVPFSMEDLQSSNRIPLLERSAVTVLAPGYGEGGMAQFARDGFTASAGYFSDAIADDDGRSEERGKGVAGRFTFAPVLRRSRVLHLGAAFEHRDLDEHDELRFLQKAGSALAPTLLRTGNMGELDEIDSVGAELGWSRRALLLQGQYVATQLTRKTRSTLDFDAWYMQASWVVSGQRYAYSRRSGMFAGVDLDKGKGTIELAVRYSALDLSDHHFHRGRSQILTLGINYYLNRNLRFMLNYSPVEAQDLRGDADREPEVLAAGVQLNF